MVCRDHAGGHVFRQDGRKANEGQFPGFACFRDLVLIEIKHLEADQKDRVNKILETKIHPAERSMFFVEIAAYHVINSASNWQAIKQEIASRLGKTIEQLLSKANAQLQSYRSRRPRKNSVNVCVILNFRVQEFSPAVVIHAIYGKIKTARPDEARFDLPLKFRPVASRVPVFDTPEDADVATGDRRSWSGLRSRSLAAMRLAHIPPASRLSQIIRPRIRGPKSKVRKAIAARHTI